MAHCLSGRAAGGAVTLVAVALLGGMMAGCQSHHLNSQLLERELRLQEDQIYRLQDVLDEKCARLEYVVQENASLKRQLGYGDSQPTRGRRNASAPRSSGGSGDAPGFVPPTVELSDPAPPSTLPPPAAPPVLEGVPPLPQSSPAGSGAGGGEAPPAASLMPEVSLPARDPDEPGSFVPSSAADAGVDSFEDGPSFAPTFVSPQAAAPGLLDESARQASALQQPVSRGEGGAIQQLSFTEQALPGTAGITPLPAGSTLERIVINRDETRIIDRDANGSADALALVFEPRDLEERLVTIAGDVVVEVHLAAAAAEAAPLASWSISAADAAATFRSTSRSRGIRLLLPWQSGPQSGFSGLVRVGVQSPRGNLVQAETPVGLP